MKIKQVGGNKFLFTNEPNKQNKVTNEVNDILDLDIPLLNKPSRSISYTIKDIYTIRKKSYLKH